MDFVKYAKTHGFLNFADKLCDKIPWEIDTFVPKSAKNHAFSMILNFWLKAVQSNRNKGRNCFYLNGILENMQKSMVFWVLLINYDKIPWEIDTFVPKSAKNHAFSMILNFWLKAVQSNRNKGRELFLFERDFGKYAKTHGFLSFADKLW